MERTSKRKKGTCSTVLNTASDILGIPKCQGTGGTIVG